MNTSESRRSGLLLKRRDILACVSVWPCTFFVAGQICELLRVLHAHGQHTRAQVAVAVAFCVVLASWAAAEVLSVLSLLRKRQARASSFRQLPKVEAEEQDVFEVAATVWASTHWDETVTRTYTVEVFLEGLLPPLRCASELAVIIVCVYLSDRTDVFAKSPLQDHSGLWGVCSALFLAALCTTTRLRTDSPLQRNQTDEWKGWMQILLVLQHYFGSTSSQHVTRQCVAAYVFLTCFGNSVLYRRSKSLTVRRCLRSVFRLNFLALVCCTALGNDFFLYAACPTATLFTFLVAVLFVRCQEDNSVIFIYVKCCLTLILILVLCRWPTDSYESIGDYYLNSWFNVHVVSVGDWRFRPASDRCVWIAGIFVALHVTDFERVMARLKTVTVSRRIPCCLLLVPGVLWITSWVWSSALMLEEGEYEAFHSSTSWIPIVAYVLMRNLCEWSRRRHLWLFSFVGRYTLEMSILQMHVLMRTEGSSTAPGYVVVLVRGSFFANLALVSVVFLFLSVRCGKITAVLLDALFPEDVRRSTVTWVLLFATASACWYVAPLMTEA